MSYVIQGAAFILASVAMFAQAPDGDGLATFQGSVRDSQGRPVAATVQLLQLQMATHTDADGSYRFTNLPAGNYTLRAQAAGAGEITAGPFALRGGETRKVDLTLQYAFFDEPNFIVAGVIDPTSHAGHGSDTVARSAEALAKAAASLSREAAHGVSTVQSQREAVVREPANAQLHHALADALEKQGNALEAVREYQRAAELDASESSLFDWGAELLRHHAAEPATEVFTKGNRLFPSSLRMLLSLAAAWYARGTYDQAARYFFEACDLDPNNPEPYLFLGKVQSTEITQLEGYVARMRRFADRRPKNAWANYYYAVALWKDRRGPEDSRTPTRVRELLETAIRIDPALGAAYLQLGIVYSDQNNNTDAIAAYQKGIEVNPQSDETHYRLAQAYARIGEQERARKELDAYQQISKTSAEEADRERREMQQFVYELRAQAPVR